MSRRPASAAFAAFAATLAVAMTAGAVGAAALPLPDVPGPVGIPTFVGSAAKSHPVYYAAPPANPFMATDGLSNIHDDAYMSNTYEWPGPLGVDPQVTTMADFGECASITFDSRGRIVSVCVSPAGPTLELIDPTTLDELASFSLPGRNLLSIKVLKLFQDFGGGGYFYLSNQGRAVIPTTTRHVYVVAENADGNGFQLVHDYDLSGVVSSNDEITSVVPDYSGRLWFVSLGGVVGTIDPATGAVHTVDSHEETENSFAVDESGGVFIVTDKALYRYDAGPSGQPEVTWRAVYPNSGIHKPGQVDAGSGTTPTVMGTRYVAIADNADPMDVVVYQRGKQVKGSRQVCVQPVFQRGAGDTENSLIGTGSSMIVENNYGYSGPSATEVGGVTAPGIARVDINQNGHGCHVVWTNEERAPTVVPKLSLSTGLVYTYTKDAGITDPWYFTAIDFATGKTVYKQFVGTGLLFNNNYAPVTLARDGSAYVGVLGGLIEVRDAVAPPALSARPPTSAHRHRRHKRR